MNLAATICLLILASTSSMPASAQVKKPVAKAKGTKSETKKPVTTPKTLATVDYREKVAASFKQQKWADVIDAANSQLKTQPFDTMVVLQKAMAYGMLGNKEMAASTLRRFYTQPDTAAGVIAVIPSNLSREVRKRDGVWYTDEAIKISPKSPAPYLMKAAYLLDDSQYDASREAAKSGYTLADDNMKKALGSTFAVILHKGGAKDDAYNIINALLQQYPDDIEIAKNYYSMLLEDKRYNDALTLLTKLITAHPDDAIRYRKERVFLYKDLNRNDEACAEAVSLAEVDPDYELLVRKINCPAAYLNVSPNVVKQYTYTVDYYGATYDFIVTPSRMDMNTGIAFDWKMTNKEDMRGSLTISKSALDNAHSEMNAFSAGNKTLDAQTSVWVSNAVYREVKQNGSSLIDASGTGLKTFNVVKDGEGQELVANANTGTEKRLRTIHIRSEDEKEDIWINDDPANPLITKMNLGWSITLHDVK